LTYSPSRQQWRPWESIKKITKKEGEETMQKYIYLRRDGAIISAPKISRKKNRWDGESEPGGVATQVVYVGDVMADGEMLVSWSALCEHCAIREEDVDCVRYAIGRTECLRIPFPGQMGAVYPPVWQMKNAFSATQITQGFIAQFDGLHFRIRSLAGDILYAVELPATYRGEEAAKEV
jgi:hypothetical protein